MMSALLQVAIAILLLTGATQAHAGLREELQEVAVAYMEAINAGDLDKAVLVYTEDCSMMAPGFDVAHGHEGVRKMWKDLHDMGIAQMDCVMEEVGPEDATDTAYDRTRCTVFDEKGNIVMKGKHIVIWKKVSGKWLAHIDNWNTDFAEMPKMDEDTLKAEFKVLYDGVAAAWKALDIATLLSFYTEDACGMPPEYPAVKGKQAIREALDIYTKGVAREWESEEWQSEEVGYLGLTKDMAYVRGQYRRTKKDGTVADEGKFVALLKRVEGQWKIYVEIWSSNTPPMTSRDEL